VPRAFQDHLNRTVFLSSYPPQRIVSLCPSQTETLAYLEAPLVGVTHFCIHPPTLKKQCIVVGGTKKVHYDRIEKLQPDLIIAEKEENTKDMVEVLATRYPVYVTNVTSIETALEMIDSLGTLMGKTEKAKNLIDSIQKGWAPLKDQFNGIRVLYLIWRNPWMTVGKNTYIHDVLTYLGFLNVASHLSEERYFTIDPQILLQHANYDFLFLSSEPFPFKEKHAYELIEQGVPPEKICFVNGEMFSWYGVRMLKAKDYFAQKRWEKGIFTQ
jgi:ABC-type Fe3+-hydroxamate transport system substrate-binding protein